jgi:ferritin-like metal-binding protein YciE
MKALPKMMQEAQSDELRAALLEHWEVTKTQATRINLAAQEAEVKAGKSAEGKSERVRGDCRRQQDEGTGKARG